MADFIHGLNTKLLLGGQNISRFFKSAGIDPTKETHETTGFGATAKTFIGGLRDATASIEGMFDGGAAGMDAYLKSILDDPANNEFSFYPEGDAQGKFGFALSGLQTAYAISASIDDVVQASAEFQSVVGAERVQSVKAEGSVAATGTSAVLDCGAGSTNTDGAAGYLHCKSVGTSAAVKIQHSSDGVTFTDLITFTTCTGADGQRVAALGTINRYLRASYTLVGGAADFQVGLARKLPIVP